MIEPRQTAADLRNAALLFEHTPKSRGVFYDPEAQSLCLEGALRLATSSPESARQLQQQSGYSALELQAYHDNQLLSLVHHGRDDARVDAAMQALKPALPTVCTLPEHETGYCALRLGHCDDWHYSVLVYHYNDFVCDGAEDVQRVLVEAAEKLEAEL